MSEVKGKVKGRRMDEEEKRIVTNCWIGLTVVFSSIIPTLIGVLVVGLGIKGRILTCPGKGKGYEKCFSTVMKQMKEKHKRLFMKDPHALYMI